MAAWERSRLMGLEEAPGFPLANYVPELTNSAIPGRITTSTFALEMPQCVFDLNSANNVWLVVAKDPVNVGTIPVATLSPYSSLGTAQYYHTFKQPEKYYPCSNTPGYIRVGDDSTCTAFDGYCNGPLPKGKYLVKFVVLDNAGTLVGQSSWSSPITLPQANDPQNIDTWPGRRSGGMIVITSILSVLLAAVLACLVGTLILGSKNLPCFQKKPVVKEVPAPEVFDLKNYKTHHLPEEFERYQ
ncbi:uroplakin-3b-like [Hyperolius riggenbachi]|uniref:uroplakin-3b-like n=1 Tax=Hyperolius riggenbachi TaxID=752182 RepID=UPI0035A2EFCF